MKRILNAGGVSPRYGGLDGDVSFSVKTRLSSRNKNILNVLKQKETWPFAYRYRFNGKLL